MTSTFWQHVDSLISQHNATSFGQGFPNWDPPEFIQDALVDAVKVHSLNQYTAWDGYPPLKATLAKVYGPLLGREINANSEILITLGAYGALFGIFQSLLGQGDEAIVLAPYFTNYDVQITFRGGKVVGVTLDYVPSPSGTQTSSNFQLNMEKLENAVTEKTKLLVLNSPHNPTGKVFSYEETKAICDFVIKHNLVLVSDEVYEWLVFSDTTPHIRPATLPGMWERTITIGSAGKCFSATGWKLGWIIAPENFIANAFAVQKASSATLPTPFQYAVKVGFEKVFEENYFSKAASFACEKLERVVRWFKEAGFEPIRPDGGYFVIVDFSNYKLANYDPSKPRDYQIIEELIVDFKIGFIACSWFYGENQEKIQRDLLRVCYCKTDETLEKLRVALVEIASVQAQRQ